jgi:hypothetical protein
MKPFDLELAKRGHPVTTEIHSLPTRIICFNKAGNYNIVGLITELDDLECVYYFNDLGECSTGGNYNLVMAERKETL